jgi:hypothetical protein
VTRFITALSRAALFSILAFPCGAEHPSNPKPVTFKITSVIISGEECDLTAIQAEVTYYATGKSENCRGMVTGNEKLGYVRSFTPYFSSPYKILYLFTGFSSNGKKYRYSQFSINSQSQ